MTETEKKALTLLNEVCAEIGLDKVSSLELDMPGERALVRAIEQHESFKREVSDAVEGCTSMVGLDPKRYFARFIIPKPDPLVEAIQAADEAHPGWESASDYAQHLRAALAARGLEVRKIGEGE